jgi:hypothetical protein
MASKLEAMQDHGSQQFQQVVRQGLQSTEEHLKEAQTIASRLEQERRSAAADRRREALADAAESIAASRLPQRSEPRFRDTELSRHAP